MKPAFIHTSDIHLGMKFKNKYFSLKERQKRREELWDAFDEIINIARNEKIPYLFIAGDLTQEDYCDFKDLKKIVNKFKSIEDTKIIMTCGRNDLSNINSIYEYVEWPQNVYIIKNSESVKKITFEEDNMCVYSLSLSSKERKLDSQLIYDISVNEDKLNVLILYCDMDETDDKKFPIDMDLIKNKFDYCAMGGIHNHIKIKENIVYSGSPEPLDFSEEGEHGIIKGILDKDNLTYSMHPISKRKFVNRDIVIDVSYDFNKILDLIKFSGDTFSNIKDYVRVNITGNVDINISIEEVKNEAKQFFYYIEFDENYIYKSDMENSYDTNEFTIMESYKLQFEKSEGNDRIHQKAFALGFDILKKEKVVR